MTNIFVGASKYILIILFAIYTYECFSAFRYREGEDRDFIFTRQNVLMFAIHLIACLAAYLKTDETQVLLFYGAQALFLGAALLLYRFLYPRASRLVVNNMCMLLTVGFIILTRLSFEKSVKQFIIGIPAMVIALCIPFMIRKFRFLKQLTWVYAVAGIALLGAVAALGAVSYGARLSLSLGGISIQPSEFVKIIFVFYVASMFYESTSFSQVAKATVVAAAYVLILVVSKDLGAALIFFIAYLIMLYVATKKPLYFLGGIAAGSLAAVVAYYLFYHVRERVIAWKDPFGVIEDQGYQVVQSLFAIGTGGFFGMGLYQGMPESIPKVEEDVIFSAVSEELGGIFALCLILVYMSCFIMFANIAMQMKDRFYKLVALGLGCVYIFQVFLTIGGGIKFIPSTGVTLPLVSYGGSSLLGTLMIFSIIQGLYSLRQDEGDHGGKAKKGNRSKKRKTAKAGTGQEG